MRGRIAALEPAQRGGLVWCALTVAKADGTTVVDGRAALRLPR